MRFLVLSFTSVPNCCYITGTNDLTCRWHKSNYKQYLWFIQEIFSRIVTESAGRPVWLVNNDDLGRLTTIILMSFSLRIPRVLPLSKLLSPFVSVSPCPLTSKFENVPKRFFSLEWEKFQEEKNLCHNKLINCLWVIGIPNLYESRCYLLFFQGRSCSFKDLKSRLYQ